MTERPNEPSPDEIVRRTVQRHAGVAALRQLREKVDAEQASEASDRRFVRRFLFGFGLLALGAVAGWLWFRGVI